MYGKEAISFCTSGSLYLCPMRRLILVTVFLMFLKYWEEKEEKKAEGRSQSEKSFAVAGISGDQRRERRRELQGEAYPS